MMGASTWDAIPPCGAGSGCGWASARSLSRCRRPCGASPDRSHRLTFCVRRSRILPMCPLGRIHKCRVRWRRSHVRSRLQATSSMSAATTTVPAALWCQPRPFLSHSDDAYTSSHAASPAPPTMPNNSALRVYEGLRVAGTGWGHYVTRMPRASKLVGLVKPWALRRRTWSRLMPSILCLRTQFPRVPAPIPRSRAISTTGLHVSRTIRTAPALNSGSNLRRVCDIASPHGRCLHDSGGYPGACCWRAR